MAAPTVEVWELQRRTTLFHKDWYAPFLPHDRQKRWRWVDSRYRRHPLAAGSIQSSALAAVPSVQLPEEWPEDGAATWTVVKDRSRGPCDSEGWQYAAEFYRGDKRWQPEPRLCHCRRRLWRCSFGVGSPDEVSLASPLVRSCSAPAAVRTEASAKTGAVCVLDDVPVLGFPSTPEAERLLACDWSAGNVIMELLESQGATDIWVGPWLRGPEGDLPGAGVREVRLTLPVPPAPMSPRTTRATVQYRVSVEDGSSFGAIVSWDAVISTHDTPFCDCYTILDKVVLTPFEDGVAVRKEFRVQFSKSTFAKAMIEAGARGGQQRVAEGLLEVLRRRAHDGESTSSAPLQHGHDLEGEVGTGIAEVWELQRRVTLFHGTWQAPFLPHDMHKQWRWVDRSYRKHPWAGEGSRRASASADKPPLGPPGGREVQWIQADAPGPSDSEGWQYAVDFVNSDVRWGSSPTLCHCRRRLWRLKEADDLDDEPSSWSGVEGAADAKLDTCARLAVSACAFAALMMALVQLAAPMVGGLGGVEVSSRSVFAACALLILLGSVRRQPQRLLRSSACGRAAGRARAWWRRRADHGSWVDEDDMENRWHFVAFSGPPSNTEV